MLENKELEESIRDLLIELCAVMFRYGYQEIPVSKMLMLLGVPEDRASTHGSDVFTYDEAFTQMWKTYIGSQQDRAPVAGNVTIH